MTVRTVHFFSDGLRIEADYLLPEGAAAGARLPGIVLCPGFGAIRKHTLPDYAGLFAAAGYAVCWLDYRGFGGSEGESERIMAAEHTRDIRAALTWLSIQPEVDPDRLGLWGTSGGAAHAVQVAGIDDRVRCAVAQIGHGDGRRMTLEHKTPGEQAQLLAGLKVDREQRVLTGKSGRMRVIDFVSDRTTREYVLGVAETDPSIITYLTLESAEAAMEYRPIDVVHRVSPRALMLIAGEKDEICRIEAFRDVFDKAGEPKRWMAYPIGHYEMYTPEWIARSAADALEWFGQYL